MSLTLSSEEQLVAELGEQRNHALQHWRDLVQARTAYFGSAPAMTPEGAAALQAVDDAERIYRDLQEQWLQAQRRAWNASRT